MCMSSPHMVNCGSNVVYCSEVPPNLGHDQYEYIHTSCNNLHVYTCASFKNCKNFLIAEYGSS